MAVNENSNAHSIFKFNESTVSDFLSFGTTLANQLNLHAEKVNDLVNKLRQNKMPNSIFKLNALYAELEGITSQPDSVLSKEELVHAMRTGKFTFPYKNCPSNIPCTLEVYSVIPIIKKDARYEHEEVLTVPTFHKGVFLNDWKQIKPPIKEFLKRNSLVMPASIEEIECQDFQGELPCSLCVKPRAKFRPVGQCLQDIIKGNNPWVHCPNKKLERSADEAIRVNATTWLYSDVQPGSLVETCGRDIPQKQQLGYSGLFKTNPDCSYTISNGPWNKEAFISPAITIMESQVDNMRESYIEQGMEHSVLGRHLKTNMYYYFVAVLSLSGTTILAFSCYCYMQRGRLRVRIFPPSHRGNRRTAQADRVDEQVEAVERLHRAGLV